MYINLSSLYFFSLFFEAYVCFHVCFIFGYSWLLVYPLDPKCHLQLWYQISKKRVSYITHFSMCKFLCFFCSACLHWHLLSRVIRNSVDTGLANALSFRNTQENCVLCLMSSWAFLAFYIRTDLPFLKYLAVNL